MKLETFSVCCITVHVDSSSNDNLFHTNSHTNSHINNLYSGMYVIIVVKSVFGAV